MRSTHGVLLCGSLSSAPSTGCRGHAFCHRPTGFVHSRYGEAEACARTLPILPSSSTSPRQARTKVRCAQPVPGCRILTGYVPLRLQVTICDGAPAPPPPRRCRRCCRRRRHRCGRVARPVVAVAAVARLQLLMGCRGHPLSISGALTNIAAAVGPAEQFSRRPSPFPDLPSPALPPSAPPSSSPPPPLPPPPLPPFTISAAACSAATASLQLSLPPSPLPPSPLLPLPALPLPAPCRLLAPTALHVL